MKSLPTITLAISLAISLLTGAVAQPSDPPDSEPAAPPADAPPAEAAPADRGPGDSMPADMPPAEAEPDDDMPADATPPEAMPGSAPPAEAAPADATQPFQPPRGMSTPAATPPSDQVKSATAEAKPTEAPMEVSPPPTHVVADGERGLRLNFRNAPLELVLDYMSEAAGYVVMPGSADVRGKVDVWSNQPLTKEEAVEVLNTVLAKNGFAAIVNGRMLKIVTTGDMKTQYSPVVSGSTPSEIPISEDVVTQIIPVKFISAVQLSRDLQPLTQTTMAANEGSNSLVVTDTQSHIRRIVEIVQALDTAISSISKVKVTLLEYADAKSVANVIRELFQDQGTSSQNRNQGGGPGRVFLKIRGGGDQGGQAASPAGGRAALPRVVAVADERSNAVVVSAPEDQMPVIEGLLKDLDQNIEDITEVRVFALQNADPEEMASVITSLFQEQNSSQSGRSQFRFGPPGMQFGGRGASSTASERTLKQTRVVAVADPRTRSVVVSASRVLMEQIAAMVKDLDADPAQKKKVFVFDVQNTDPDQVQQILQSLFPSPSGASAASRSYQNQRRAGSQLNTRAQQNQNTGFGRTSTGFGNTGFGNTGMRGQ